MTLPKKSIIIPQNEYEKNKTYFWDFFVGMKIKRGLYLGIIFDVRPMFSHIIRKLSPTPSEL